MATFFAPERPRLTGTTEPKIIDSNVVLPTLELYPREEDGGWDVCAFLPTDGNMRFSFSRHEIVVSAEEGINAFLTAWLADPERVLKERFRWESTHKVKTQRERDAEILKELGLGD